MVFFALAVETGPLGRNLILINISNNYDKKPLKSILAVIGYKSYRVRGACA